MRIPLVLLSLLFASTCLVQADDRLGAIAAMQALPPRFQNGVLRLSADEGRPNPQTWYLVARDVNRDEVPRNFTVVAGAVTSERRAFNLRTLVEAPSPMNLSRIKIDSRDAWDIAERFSSGRNRRLGSVSYLLQQQGRDASPIWTVWCYDLTGGYIGVVSFLATTGAITSNR